MLRGSGSLLAGFSLSGLFVYVIILSLCFIMMSVDPLHARKKQKVIHTERIRTEVQSFFKNTRIVRVLPSEIEGLYEVYYVGEYPGLFYYHPGKKLLVFGEIFTVNGTPVTAEKVERFIIELQQKEKGDGEDGDSREGGKDRKDGKEK